MNSKLMKDLADAKSKLHPLEFYNRMAATTFKEMATQQLHKDTTFPISHTATIPHPLQTTCFLPSIQPPPRYAANADDAKAAITHVANETSAGIETTCIVCNDDQTAVESAVEILPSVARPAPCISTASSPTPTTLHNNDGPSHHSSSSTSISGGAQELQVSIDDTKHSTADAAADPPNGNGASAASDNDNTFINHAVEYSETGLRKAALQRASDGAATKKAVKELSDDSRGRKLADNSHPISQNQTKLKNEGFISPLVANKAAASCRRRASTLFHAVGSYAEPSLKTKMRRENNDELAPLRPPGSFCKKKMSTFLDDPIFTSGKSGILYDIDSSHTVPQAASNRSGLRQRSTATGMYKERHINAKMRREQS
ncbi:hypothetical protein CYMTET_12855 [Cymbomonas tetramitiformis]|uniref:Uncharacterized protein n=1 Tax=Cymbomonas tetramitiformis TaxID=36881 RepID=A0AAE0GJG2_9CHLO|nr:hypothetical protein CYMTET_12855 [Cymbomonas tetramitiformis]